MTASLFGGGSLNQGEMIPTYDAGKPMFKFRYEYLTSEGPKIGQDFQNPDDNLAHLADGKWRVNVEKTEDAG